jgi:four helix bundle protein
MSLIVHQFAVETIAALRPLVGRIAQHDRSLAKQLQAAASSMALNIGEAQYSDPGNRRARFHSAAGSAGETRTALEVAVAWGYLASPQAKEALRLLDRVVAMLWRLSRGPR